ncbi:MAG TPA: 2OG-Fe(II) oxygenase [Burkholderiales bacterium]|nr:2OG-Fe(II) oxygenase [Burkholderiales bacterium]
MASAESAYSAAVSAAYGADVKDHLKSALEHLQRAAEQGHRGAQTELAGLVGNFRLSGEITRGKALPTGTWERLRAAVDLAGWLSFPAGRALCQQPRIAMVKRFLSPGLCDWLIEQAQPHLQRAQTFALDDGKAADDGARTNTAAEFLPGRIDTLLSFVRARIAGFTGMSTGLLETSQVLHYSAGELFAPHYDFLDIRQPGLARQVTEHGQRVLTLLIYLNEGYEDGETYFPKLQRGFKGRKGDALVFWNVTPDGAPDPLTLHMGSAPTRGEKWLFSQWIRMR